MKSAEIARPPVYRISLVQVLTLVVVSFVVAADNTTWASSVFCGGLIAIIPQAYFAARVFRWRGARNARSIARSSYSGQVGKFVLTAAGFAAVFVLLRPISGAGVFAGYLLMLVIQIIGSWKLLK